ncbi:MAG: hypothetical protein ACI81V_000953 [Lentimonas sp.]
MSRRDIGKLELKYVVLKFDDTVAAQKRSEGRIERKKGTAEIPALAAHSEYEVTTETFKMLNTHLEVGYVWKDGGQSKSEDRLDGIWVKLYSQGVQVYEDSRPQSMMRNEAW